MFEINPSQNAAFRREQAKRETKMKDNSEEINPLGQDSPTPIQKFLIKEGENVTEELFGHQDPEKWKPNPIERTVKISQIEDNQEEIWKDVVGYEGYYKVSNIGNIKSIDRVVQYKITSKLKKGKPIKAHCNMNGYLMVPLYKDRKLKHNSVQRLVCKAFILNPENKPFVNHKNSIRTDNRADNLEWCTHLENMAHSRMPGVREKFKYAGEKSGKSKLTNEQVLLIRKLKPIPGNTFNNLAKRFNVCTVTIQNIIYGRSWIQLQINSEP